uniref:Uncharacterized protein n=1 Tax=Lobelia laxa TaxID=2041130 RepID=A0A291EYZ3_9ASTR|nr:hypothetical protein Lo_lxa1Pt0574 [Lobelia laxa]ATG25058.1 hypothetical protein Lo_lxa1Pt0574 [Lobelia laxa]
MKRKDSADLNKVVNVFLEDVTIPIPSPGSENGAPFKSLKEEWSAAVNAAELEGERFIDKNKTLFAKNFTTRFTTLLCIFYYSTRVEATLDLQLKYYKLLSLDVARLLPSVVKMAYWNSVTRHFLPFTM